MPPNRASSAFLIVFSLLVACGARMQVIAPARAEAVTPVMKASEALVVQVRQVDSGLGTGLIVATDGYVLTNHHVIEIQCESDEAAGTQSCSSGLYEVCTVYDHVWSCTRAELIAWDEERDLALLKTGRTFRQAAVFGDETLLGDAEDVYAWISVGLILPPSLFLGRYVNRVDPRFAPVSQASLIFDLSANHGGSGGPIFNGRGEVVALMTGFTKIVNDPAGFDNGAPLAVSVPASDIVKFLKTQGRLEPQVAETRPNKKDPR
jgi:S1-C subfamily serine protease